MKTLKFCKPKLIECFGGTSVLAGLFGVTRQAIYQWPDVIIGKTASHALFLAHANNIDVRCAVISD